ncbi:flocculation protein FLO11-like isoform X1 [Varroa destructor]|uniref:Cuticle protein n=1 Tax=Varroa destructor TaxID=109461 RepID=A0A7M7JDC5_VARDE|nr:flocculation protein FLO11-like isoform X1 [Varroa destructor]
MRLHTKKLHTIVWLVLGVSGADIVLAGGSSRQEKVTTKASFQSERTPATTASASSAVIQTVEAPIATTLMEKADAPIIAPPSNNSPVVLNKILVSQSAPQLVPIAYEFSYGTPSHSHVQNKQPDGIIKGRYVIHAPDGQHRTVDYVADKGGFRAGVATNEPGTETTLEGASKIVSSAMKAVDAALKFGPRHPSKNAQTIKQVPLPMGVAPVRQPTPVSPVKPMPHHEEMSPQSYKPVAQIQQSPAEGSAQFAPVRIVDIQPLPTPLVRIAQFEQPSPTSRIEVVRPHSMASPARIDEPPLPLLEPFPPLPADNAVTTVIKPVTLSPPPTNPSATVLHLSPHFASSAQIISDLIPRVEIIPPQPALFHRPVVHTVSEVSQSSPPQLLGLEPSRSFPPIDVEISRLPAQPPGRVTAQPSHSIAQPPTRVEIIRPTVVNTGFTALEPTQQLVTPGPVSTIGKNIARVSSLESINDAQIFEVKTKVVPVDRALPPTPLSTPVTESVVTLPQRNSRHLLAPPKPQPHGSGSVKMNHFTAGQQGLTHPMGILRNLPATANRIPSHPEPIRFPESVVLVAISPYAPSPTNLSRSNQNLGNNESIRKFFSLSPSKSEHQIAVNKFFSNIKQHHLNEVKMVKKHEDHLQAVASRVLPFFHIRSVGSMSRPRMPAFGANIFSVLH